MDYAKKVRDMETTTSSQGTTTLPAICHSPTTPVTVTVSSPVRSPVNKTKAIVSKAIISSESPHSSRESTQSPDNTFEKTSEDDTSRPVSSSPPSTLSLMQTTKNKRKNFSPRCSATEESNLKPIDSTIIIPSSKEACNSINENEDVIAKTPLNQHETNETTIVEGIPDDALSINWRKCFIENSTINNEMEDNKESQSLLNQEHTDLLSTATAAIPAVTDIENNKFYNIPNTNFSIAKTQAAFAAAAAAAVSTNLQQRLSAIPITNTFAHQPFNQPNLHHQTNDSQFPLQFAFFQELFNVYGFSISNNDIVDALKKQAAAGVERHNSQPNLEPPTPPRTPINTASTTTGTGHTTLTAPNASLDDSHHTRNSTMASSSNSLPKLSVRPVNKLMANNNQQNVYNNNNKALTEGSIDRSTGRGIRAKRSTSKDYQNSDLDEDGDRDYDLDDYDQKSNSATSSRRYKRKQDRNYHSSNKRRNSDATLITPISDLEDDDDDDAREHCDGEQRLSSDSGDESASLIGRNTGARLKSSGINSVENFNLNDTSYDSVSASLLLQQHKGDSNASKASSHDFFEKSSLNFLSPMMQLTALQGEENQLTDSSKYLTKYASFLDCNNEQCCAENLREHYHCLEALCMSENKVLCKKEEIIRHLKWHKKRNESLTHGFLRFSSSDDCSTQFQQCTHNRKQTHYHCLQQNCDKVYISTSDVQMHSNYHRKDSAIFQEGFQRYRATEECNVEYCNFSGQRTTHFHCRRNNCTYTFKNKADMEKHKSYHIKDEQLARDGFKKFLKNEPCPFDRCRFSRQCNHIHCVRENCFYVLHSSGQLLSHKRKHERMDSEQAYRRFKMAQKVQMISSSIGPTSDSNDLSQMSPPPASHLINQRAPSVGESPEPSMNLSFASSNCSSPLLDYNKAMASMLLPTDLSVSLQPKSDQTKGQLSLKSLDFSSLLYGGGAAVNSITPIDLIQQLQYQKQLLLKQQQNLQSVKEENTADDSGNLELNNSIEAGVSRMNVDSLDQSDVIDRYANASDIHKLSKSLFTDNCSRQRHIASENDHGKAMEQSEPLNLNLKSNSAQRSNQEEAIQCTLPSSHTLADQAHLHCLVPECETVISKSLLEIAEHTRTHQTPAAQDIDNMRNIANTSDAAINDPKLLQITSIDGFFNRKRGRPPKNRVVEVYNNIQQHQQPQAIFTSFKLEKNEQNAVPHQNISIAQTAQSVCFDVHCPYSVTETFANAKKQNCPLPPPAHYHCMQNNGRCHFVTKESQVLDKHTLDAHTNGAILNIYSRNNFECFYGPMDCQINGCSSKKRINQHWHCQLCQQEITEVTDMDTHVCHKNQSVDTINNNKQLKIEQAVGRNASKSPKMGGNDDSFNADNSENGERGSDRMQISREYLDNDSINSKRSSSILTASPNNNDDEKISVVRASGTFFPQNCDGEQQLSPKKPHQSSPQSESETIDLQSDGNEIQISSCQRPFCKLKKKSHQHCDLCNQAFTDEMKLKIHYLKHQSTKLGNPVDADQAPIPGRIDTPNVDLPPDLSSFMANVTAPSNSSLEMLLGSQSLAGSNALDISSAALLNNPSSVSAFADQFSSQMQNLHLAHIASFYQQNPFYYQHLYSILSGMEQQKLLSSKTGSTPSSSSAHLNNPFIPFGVGGPFDLPQIAAASVGSNQSSAELQSLNKNQQKRKLSALHDDLYQGPAKKSAKSNKSGHSGGSNCSTGSESGNGPGSGNFKMFKDEPIPQGYLKFRFNEDCNFSNCGYRNHQSHFHCCRTDCYYSFCDKTRFVQHTARHERLDKLMGDDFKQFRANMRCGFPDCAYSKNMGGNNKSSHFHCLKCSFICSDTNKVVAHRRQHSKLEYIRDAGFRKVANNEKCIISGGDSRTSTPANGESADGPSEDECSYSLKQTHYHCLVCNCSVLSRAQLGSHRHRVS